MKNEPWYSHMANWEFKTYVLTEARQNISYWLLSTISNEIEGLIENNLLTDFHIEKAEEHMNTAKGMLDNSNNLKVLKGPAKQILTLNQAYMEKINKWNEAYLKNLLENQKDTKELENEEINRLIEMVKLENANIRSKSQYFDEEDPDLLDDKAILLNQEALIMLSDLVEASEKSFVALIEDITHKIVSSFDYLRQAKENHEEHFRRLLLKTDLLNGRYKSLEEGLGDIIHFPKAIHNTSLVFAKLQYELLKNYLDLNKTNDEELIKKAEKKGEELLDGLLENLKDRSKFCLDYYSLIYQALIVCPKCQGEIEIVRGSSSISYSCKTCGYVVPHIEIE